MSKLGSVLTKSDSVVENVRQNKTFDQLWARTLYTLQDYYTQSYIQS